MNNGKICVSVCARTADEMIAKIKRAEEFADVIEVRFDCLDEKELNRCRSEVSNSTIKMPLLLTFRPKEQGGRRTLTLAERLRFWQAELNQPKPNTIIDIEAEPDIALAVSTNKLQRIISQHYFDGGPESLKGVFDGLSAFDGDIYKIAIKAFDATDALDIWQLIKSARTLDKQIIPIAMGEAGKWTRILGLAHGAYMTYASLDEGEETADGQIAARDMIDVYRVKELDRQTAVYGVIGDPVSSSLSPYMHNAAFASHTINAVFLPLLVKDLDEFIRRMVAPATREVDLNFAGFSITMPHKQTIMKHLDEIDATAARIGAVNTVKITDGKLIGYNTDAHGFITPLKTEFGDLKNARVAVLGAGGAARACVYALMQEGAEVTVLARDPRKARLLADEFNVSVAQPHTGDRTLAVDIVVNATPTGMKGALETASPVTPEQLAGVKFVYDLVTRSQETPLLRSAQAAGIEAIGGVEMLVEQGVGQFEIWTGREAPKDIMRQAVLERLK